MCASPAHCYRMRQTLFGGLTIPVPACPEDRATRGRDPSAGAGLEAGGRTHGKDTAWHQARQIGEGLGSGAQNVGRNRGHV
jgi:hypothetical protein